MLTSSSGESQLPTNEFGDFKGINIGFPEDKRLTPGHIINPGRRYQLRLIVHKIENLRAQGHEFFPDVYIKAKLNDVKEVTDIHYGSMKGIALFNYRLIFPLMSQAEIIINPLSIYAMDFDDYTRDDLLGC